MSRMWLQVLELFLDNQGLQSKSSTWNQGFQINKSVAEMIQETAVWISFTVDQWVAELFLSLNNWGLSFLQNKCSQFSQIYLSPEKLKKIFTLQSCKFLNDKIDQNINFC